jgi:hypothetical protein
VQLPGHGGQGVKRDGIVEHVVPVPDVEYHASNAPEKREESAMTAFGTIQQPAASKSVDVATML